MSEYSTSYIDMHPGDTLFQQHLTRAVGTTLVIDFGEQARESRLWLIASRPDKAVA